MANDDSSDQKEKINSMGIAKWISIYTVALSFICIFMFGYIIADGKPFKLFDKPKEPNIAKPAEESDKTKPAEESDTNAYGYHRLGIYLLVLFSGAFGGCLYNFRGIKKHLEEKDFESNFALSYFLRPLSAAMCGVFVFFLVLSGVFVMSLGNADFHSNEVKSIMLYVAISMLAGYGSHEFLKKVKDIMKTVFTLSEQEKK